MEIAKILTPFLIIKIDMVGQSRRQLLKTGGGLISTLGLAGCLRLTSQTAETESPSTESPSAEPRSTTKPVTAAEQSSVDLEQYWEVEESYGEVYIPEKCGIACRDTVYVSGGSDPTQIRAFDLLNGAEVWSFQVEGDRVGVLNLTADQTNLYGLVALYDPGEAFVLNLDRQTGEEIWSTDNIFYDVQAELTLLENRLVISENADFITNITILDKESGEKEDEIGGIPRHNSFELHGVTTTPESLYLSANNNIYSYSFTDSELEHIAEGAANTGPVVKTVTNSIYQPTQQSIKRIDMTTNSLDWEADVRTVVKPVVDRSGLICASASGISSISTSDGDTNWINTNESVTPGNFDLEDRYIWYTPDNERTGHLIDANGGSTEYTFDGSVLSMDSNFQQYAVVATMDRLVGYQFDW